jgi:nitroreductase
MAEEGAERIHSDGSPDLTRRELIACVEAAILAPSIHNSQPWRFRISDEGVDVFADWSRQLELIDAQGRELIISVGAATFNMRLAVRQRGRVPVVQRWPDPTEPGLVARVAPGPPARPDAVVSQLAAAVPLRHTNRRPFAAKIVPASVLSELATAAEAEGASLVVVDAAGRAAILDLVRDAERVLRSRGIYRAEHIEWTHLAHGHRDGLPRNAFGPWDALEALPLRDFGMTQPQRRTGGELNEPYPAIAVLTTDGDSADHWLTAGEALQGVLLAATVRGLASTPFSQPLEIPALRELVTGSNPGRWAQVILRLGYAQPTALTPRRPLADVLI